MFTAHGLMDRLLRAEPLRSGTRLGGWALERPISASSFSIVYRAHADDGGVVAIKEYTPARAGVSLSVDLDETAVRQGLHAFAADAHTLATLASPNRARGIVAVRELLKANGTVYAVMDYERGTPLSQLLECGEHLDEAQLIAIIRRVVKGLRAAHEVGVLHRSIHPSDIIVGPHNDATLVGFCSRPGLLLPKAFKADPYSAPEQRGSGPPLGPYTDLYALGVVLRRCVSGSDNPGDWLTEASRVGYSAPFLNAIETATSEDFEQRPKTIAAWLDGMPLVSMSMLGQTLVESPGHLPDVGMPSETPVQRRRPRELAQTTPPTGESARPAYPVGAGRGRVVWAAIGAALLVVALAAALILGRSRTRAIELQALDRDLAASVATVQAIDLDTRQILLDGVPKDRARTPETVERQAREALELQRAARRELGRSADGQQRQALQAKFAQAGDAIARAELRSLLGVIAAYDADAEQRAVGIDARVGDLRVGLAKISGRSGDEIASRIDVVWPLFSRSGLQLRRLSAERSGITSAANARQLLREVKLAQHANSEARANLEGLANDAGRVIANDRIDVAAYRNAARALRSSIAHSDASASAIAMLSRSSGSGGDPRLARLAAEARQRTARSAAMQRVAVAGDLPAARGGLAEALATQADLDTMLAEAQQVRRTESVRRTASRIDRPTASSSAAEPPLPPTGEAVRITARQTNHELTGAFDRYRSLRRELTRAYRARRGEPSRNARDFVEADHIYAAIVNLRQLKLIVDGAQNPGQEERSYRQFKDARLRVESRMESLRRILAQR